MWLLKVGWDKIVQENACWTEELSVPHAGFSYGIFKAQPLSGKKGETKFD